MSYKFHESDKKLSSLSSELDNLKVEAEEKYQGLIQSKGNSVEREEQIKILSTEVRFFQGW